jgi:hypothetical protein
MPSLTTLARRHAAMAATHAEATAAALATAQAADATAEAAHKVAAAAAYLAGSPARIARLRAIVARGSEYGPAEDVDRDMHRARPDLVRYTPAAPERYGYHHGRRYPARAATSAPGPLAADALALIDRLAREATP